MENGPLINFGSFRFEIKKYIFTDNKIRKPQEQDLCRIE